MIFPRYHQLDVVRKLVADARLVGAGKNYLIEHSAGSGKSNSIAWLAYRLGSLHNANDDKVFDSVIVVTDRNVLDQQLQNTIYQFEHHHTAKYHPPYAHGMRNEFYLISELAWEYPSLLSCFHKAEIFLIPCQNK